MNEKNLVICDKEFRYANSLGENISQNKKVAIQVHVCSTFEHVLELSKKKKIHILIVDDSFSVKERERIDAQKTFVLGREKVPDLRDEETFVFKYQSAKSIMQQIFECYMKENQEDLRKYVSAGKSRIVGVYSPVHRIGKSTFALSMAKECAKTASVLYLNLEEYPSNIGFDTEDTMGDLIYYLRQGDCDLNSQLKSITRQLEHVDYLPPISVAVDYRQVSESEWKGMLQCILNSGLYETIILDFGDAVQGLYTLLDCCDTIYFPMLEEEESQQKIRRFEWNLAQIGMESLLYKIHRFIMPQDAAAYGSLRGKEMIR